MFNILKSRHPTVKAYLYQNDIEINQKALGYVEGVLLAGTGVDMIDIEPHSSGFRLFCNHDDFKKIPDILPEELGGYFFGIDKIKYSIENVKISKTNYTNQIKFILIKHAN